MKKVSPMEREEGMNNNNLQGSSNIVFYDLNEQFTSKCRICFRKSSRLVNPCRCSFEYHQHCLLKYIRGRLLAMGTQVDFSQIKCRHCGDQIRFQYQQNAQCGCNYFAAKIRRNWCSKTLSIILFLFVAIVSIAIVISQLMDPDTVAYLVLMVIEGLLAIVELSMVFVFVHYNLMYREVILLKVYHCHQVMRPTHSSSDEEQQISHQNIEIIIAENY